MRPKTEGLEEEQPSWMHECTDYTVFYNFYLKDMEHIHDTALRDRLADKLAKYAVQVNIERRMSKLKHP